MESRSVVVKNISCNHCIHTIERELGEIKGVQNVKADLNSKVVTVNWDTPATWDQIVGKMQEIDYAPDEPASRNVGRPNTHG